jgi:hypothetical protein
MLRRMSSTEYAGARPRSSSEWIVFGSKPASAQRRSKNGTLAAALARSRRRASCTRSISSGSASHPVSKYSGGGGYASTRAW